MNHSAIVRSPKGIPLGYALAIAAALLGALPAYGGELYDSYSPPYRYGYQYGPGPNYQDAGYRPGCSPCGCWRCGCGRCGCVERCGCTDRCGPIVERRGNIFERRIIEREYIERRYAAPAQVHCRPCGYEYTDSRWPSVPYGYEERRPTHFPYGYGGIRWQTPPVSYGYTERPYPPAEVTGLPPRFYPGGYFE